MSLRLRIFVVLLLYAFVALSGARSDAPLIWRYASGQLMRQSGEAPPSTNGPTLGSVDLDGDGRVERLLLEDGRVQIISAGQTVWRSPDDWQTPVAQWADLNRDGQIELALLVWRPFRPWPVDRFRPYGGQINTHQDSRGQSCHVILIGWQRDEYRQLWAGSALARPLLTMAAADLDGDGWDELAVLEGDYQHPHAPASSLAIWAWNGFGFDLQDRQPGRFLSLQVRSAVGEPPVLFTR